MNGLVIRDAVVGDAAQLAVVHHTTWRDTYADLLPEEHYPRAQVFYAKHGFTPDGARLVDGQGIAEIRMVRPVAVQPSSLRQP